MEDKISKLQINESITDCITYKTEKKYIICKEIQNKHIKIWTQIKK